MAEPYQPVIKEAGQAYVDRDAKRKKATHVMKIGPKPLDAFIAWQFGRRIPPIELCFQRNILHWKKNG